jgi:polyisoprenoid-binding protein YceI
MIGPESERNPMRPALSALILMLAAGSALPALARPLDYVLEAEGSLVGFEVGFNEGTIRGTFPVAEADLTLDFDRAANSRALVVLDAAGAEANIPFATQAMKSDGVLATDRFPEISFESTGFRREGDAAVVTGMLTLRGQTRPVTLSARVFRPQGTDPGYRERLAVQLTGTVRRSEFGATGFADMVGDEVRLKILARLVLSP